MSELRHTLEAARHRGLSETNAQGVFRSLKELRTSDAVHRSRWIWELLQNAADAATAGTPNHVEIEVTETKVIFRHQGASFTPDQIFHLIYHGSSKQEEETDKLRFGTGFLTVHLISDAVYVRGMLATLDRDKPFAFPLNRSGSSWHEVRNRMEEAWAEFERSLETAEAGDFTTSYECLIHESANGIVSSGLQQLKTAAAQVIALVPEIGSISIIEPEATTSWSRIVTEVAGPHVDILKKIGTESEPTRVVVIGNHQESIALVVRLKKLGNDWCVLAEPELPRLFYPLPLVATADLPFPFAVASNRFEARETRDGIHAGKPNADDKAAPANWQLLSRIPQQYRELLSEGTKQSWLELFRLFEIRSPQTKEWLDRELFTERVLEPILEFVRSEHAPHCVPTNQGEVLKPSDLVLPHRPEAAELGLLLHALTPVSNRLPSEEALEICTSMIEGWADITTNDPTSFDQCWGRLRLAEFVSGCESIEGLQQTLAQGTEVWDWLRAAHRAAGTELANLSQEFSWLPNQHGKFAFERDLLLDGGIDFDLKNIAEALGTDLRRDLLDERADDSAKALFRQRKSGTLSVDDGIRRCRDALSGEDRDSDSVHGAGRFIDWLVRTERTEWIAGIPVICEEGSRELSRGSDDLLAPVAMWAESARPFADLWEEESIVHDDYASEISAKSWASLEEAGFVRLQLLASTELTDLSQDLSCDELADEEHVLKKPLSVRRIYDFSGNSGIRERASKAKKTSLQFLKFLLKHLINQDDTWENLASVQCTCGKTHTILPGWLADLRTTEWIYGGRNKRDAPTAGSLAGILDNETRQLLLREDRCGAFLLKLGVGVGDIIRTTLPDEQKLRLDRISAGVYGNTDPSVTQGIEALLAYPDLADVVLDKRSESERVLRNQATGRLVEDLIKNSLASSGVAVVRRPVGSDFEVASDYIEDGTQQVLDIGETRFLVEIKSTTEPFVRMTIAQGKRACEDGFKAGYSLCVVPNVVDGADLAWVRSHVRFVVGVFRFVEGPVANAAKLKTAESAALACQGGEVDLDVDVSTVKLRVHETVWGTHGVGFDDFVAIVASP